MPTAVIVDAVRTAGGKRNGKLSGWHPADLAGELLDAIGTAEILETVFHDLHWVGLTPDRVVRYVRKRLLVMPYDYRNPRAKGIGLALLAVEMKTDDVDAALKQLSDEWRDLRSERFDAE